MRSDRPAISWPPAAGARDWARPGRGRAATPNAAPPTRKWRRVRRRRLMSGMLSDSSASGEPPLYDRARRGGRLRRAYSVEALPVELHTVTGTLGREGGAGLQSQRLGDEPIEAEAVGFEVRAIRRRRQQMHGDIMRSVRRHRQAERLGEMTDLHEHRHPPAVGHIG